MDKGMSQIVFLLLLLIKQGLLWRIHGSNSLIALQYVLDELLSNEFKDGAAERIAALRIPLDSLYNCVAQAGAGASLFDAARQPLVLQGLACSGPLLWIPAQHFHSQAGSLVDQAGKDL